MLLSLLGRLTTASIPLVLSISLSALSFASAWVAQGWRYQAKLSDVRAESLQALAELERGAREVESKFRQLEHLRQTELEKERENYLRAQQETALALDNARTESDRLRNIIAAERRKARAAAATTAGTVAASEAPWVVLEQCRREYEGLAKDADELTDRLRLAAGYARVVSGAQND